MLTDEAKIRVIAGKGGDGLVSFRREKYVPRGGPDGGDGGKGGDVYLLTKEGVHTLSKFASQKVFKAENGKPGMKSKKTGRSEEDLILEAPPGTMIKNAQTGEVLADLKTEGEKILLVKGGRGGWGNYHFATPVRQAPKFARPGAPGEQKELILELKLLADVGIIGLPNSGKSTLLSRISAARPKIADYPFTTLEPNLGKVDLEDFSFVAADIPGLIEGAHQGKGLGDKFLRHIERTKLLLHLLDVTSPDLKGDYQKIRQELKAYSPKLEKIPEIVVLTKMDISQKPPKFPKAQAKISAVTGKGIKELLYLIKNALRGNSS